MKGKREESHICEKSGNVTEMVKMLPRLHWTSSSTMPLSTTSSRRGLWTQRSVGGPPSCLHMTVTAWSKNFIRTNMQLQQNWPIQPSFLFLITQSEENCTVMTSAIKRFDIANSWDPGTAMITLFCMITYWLEPTNMGPGDIHRWEMLQLGQKWCLSIHLGRG